MGQSVDTSCTYHSTICGEFREEAVVMHRRNLIKMIRNNEIKLGDLAELADKTLICFCS